MYIEASEAKPFLGAAATAAVAVAVERGTKRRRLSLSLKGLGRQLPLDGVGGRLVSRAVVVVVVCSLKIKWKKHCDIFWLREARFLHNIYIYIFHVLRGS